MRRVRACPRWGVLLGLMLMGVPWLIGTAQGCSVQSYVDGRCSAELALSARVREDHRVTESWGSLLIALATLQREPEHASQMLSSPPPLVGISYLTIQRLMLAPPEERSVESQMIWDFGRVAQLEARLRNIDAIMRALLEEFFQSHSSLSQNRELTVLINVDSLGLFLPTQIEGLSSFALDERLHLSLSRATITLRTTTGFGSVMGQIELDPKDFEISKEKVGIELAFGPTSLSGITTFEQGVGLISQVYSIKAQVGNVELVGQAVFTSTSQEFTIGVSIAGIALSGSSLITPSSFTQSLLIEIPIMVRKK